MMMIPFVFMMIPFIFTMILFIFIMIHYSKTGLTYIYVEI